MYSSTPLESCRKISEIAIRLPLEAYPQLSHIAETLKNYLPAILPTWPVHACLRDLIERSNDCSQLVCVAGWRASAALQPFSEITIWFFRSSEGVLAFECKCFCVKLFADQFPTTKLVFQDCLAWTKGPSHRIGAYANCGCAQACDSTSLVLYPDSCIPEKRFPARSRQSRN